MKRLPLIALTLITLTASAQQQRWVPISKLGTDSIVDLLIIEYPKRHSEFGIRAGINFSYFNHGDKHYTGMEYTYGSIIAGLYDKIPLSSCADLQVELLYSSLGAKHPSELNPNGDRRTFKTSYIQLPVTLSPKLGTVNLQGGFYLAKLIGAKNYDLFSEGPNFSWHVGSKHWGYYQSWDWGLVAGLGINLHPLNFEIHYKAGLHNVRHDDYDWRGVRDYARERNHNASLDCSLYIPLNTFNQ